MIINHNMMAMNTHRQLGVTGNFQAKSMEKLSSGFRINRAGDDAAGLSISEKMRAQVRGLNQASRNAQDGISMIQTAEGALTETHSILQRMRELAVQSSNDSNVKIDRKAINDEIEQLKSEIDRIGNTTEFNTQSLLKGDGSSSLDKTNIATMNSKMGDVTKGKTEYTGATQELTAVKSEAATVDGKKLVVTLNGEKITVNFKQDTSLKTDGSAKVDTDSKTNNSIDVLMKGTVAEKDTATAIKEALNSVISSNDVLSGNYSVKNADAKVTISAEDTGEFAGEKGYIAKTANTDVISAEGAKDVGDTVYTQATSEIDFSSATVDKLIGKGFTIGNTQFEFYNADKGAYKGEAVGINISAATDASSIAKAVAKQLPKDQGYTASVASATLTLTSTIKGKEGNNSLTVEDGGIQKEFKAEFQIGANEGQTMEIGIDDMRTKALGIEEIDLSTKEGAKAAITTINDAIETVSTQRSKLGAFQNRLEHSIRNLDTSSENLQASESRIRDVDMAQEMMNLTKNNILQQAAQSMLAQANQAPQGVLSLLR